MSEQLDNSQLRKQIFGSGFVLLVRQAFTIILKLIGALIVSRILGPNKYGAYIAAFGIFTFLLGVGQAGVGVYLVRRSEPPSEIDFGTATTLMAAMGLVLAITIEIFASAIAAYTKIPGFLDALRIMMIALPIQVMSVPGLARIERSLDLKGVAIVELVSQSAYYIVALPLALSGLGAVALALSMIVQYSVALALITFISKAKISFKWDGEVAKSIFRYSSSFSAANYLWQLRSLINPFIVGPVLGAYTVGIIGMTISVLEVLTVVRTMIWRITVAALARFQGDRDKMRRIISEGMEIQLLLIGTVLLGFGWVGEWIVPIVFGARWLGIFQVYPFIALSYLTISTFNMHTVSLSVMNKNWLLAVYQGLHVAIFAVTTVIAVNFFGPIGYGLGEISTLVSYIALHTFVARVVGAPDYRLTVMWWGSAAIGLFWHTLGIWAIFVPFVALASPPSIRRIKSIYNSITQSMKQKTISPA